VCGQAESREEKTLNLLNKAIVTAGVLLLSVFSVFPSAQAHSDLISSDPVAGASLEQIPESFSLTFNEELISIEGETINTLSLEDAAGKNYPLSEVEILEEVLTASAISGQYPAGEYLLTYRVVSADGHPITGEITFSTQSPTTIDVDLGLEVTYQEEEQERYSSNVGFLIAAAIFLILSIFFGVRFIRRDSQ
jgi:methionine-rich copper-binding protein CopC